MPLLTSPARPARPGWAVSLARAARLAAPGRRAVRPWLPAAGFLASAVFATLVALVSDEPVHRLWGCWAAAGYGLAALIASCGPAMDARSRPAAARTARSPSAAGRAALSPDGAARSPLSLAAAMVVALAGAVLVPLGTLAAAGRGMPEVGVTERAAALLLEHGSPYLPAARLAGHGFLIYNPYLPAMTVFGLPHAVFGPGPLTDPRLWAGLTFATAALAAFRVAGLPGRASANATAVLVATPVIAFPLVVSGNDVPVLGLTLLGLALAGASHDARNGLNFTPVTSATAVRLRRIVTPAVAAGAVLGLAAAMKATAWPALAVAGALLASRAGWPEARRAVAKQAVARFAAAAAAVFTAALLPWLITAPDALLRNTVLFPLGLAAVASPAASPLPGHLLAAAGPAGHLIALAALAAAALIPAAFLVLSPPRTGAAAVRRLAGWLALLFALAPDSRWGYFCYPAGLAAWLWLRGGLRWPAAGSGQRGEKITDGLAAAGVEGDLHPGVPAGLRRA
jgi:hypothetical protein